MAVQSKLIWWGKFAISAGLLGALFTAFDLKLAALHDNVQDWSMIALALAIPLFLVQALSTNRWRFLLRVQGIEESIAALWRLNWIALFLGLFLPGGQGFDALRVYFIEVRHPGKRGVAGSTVLVERIISISLLGLVSLAALPFLKDLQEFRTIALAVVLANLAIIAGLTLLFLVRDRHLDRLLSADVLQRLKVVRYLRALYSSVIRFDFRRGLLPTVVLLIGFHLAVILALYLVFLAYGVSLPFVYHLVFYPMIGLLLLVPVSVGGFGVREGLYAFFYSLVGVRPEAAITASLMNYAIMILLPALLGGVMLLWGQLRGVGAAGLREV